MQHLLDFDAPRQDAELARVSGRIATLVMQFCREHQGQTFHLAALHAYVQERAAGAPGSPDRILRDLRTRGLVSYEVVSRSQSEYRVTAAGGGA